MLFATVNFRGSEFAQSMGEKVRPDDPRQGHRERGLKGFLREFHHGLRTRHD